MSVTCTVGGVAPKSTNPPPMSAEFESNIAKGIDFYRTHFIREDGAARYFHDRTYPIDIHSVAQTILTLVEFSDRIPDCDGLLNLVYRWAITHMWDEHGFFYYRQLRSLTIRTPYMRWSEAWMLMALTQLLRHQRGPSTAKHQRSAALVS